MKNFKDFVEALDKDSDDPCWKGYVQLGTKKKNGKEVPNCVPKEEVELDEASKEQMLKTYHKYKDKLVAAEMKKRGLKESIELDEAKMTYWVGIPKVEKGKIKKHHHAEVKAKSEAEAKQKAADFFENGYKPNDIKVVRKYQESIEEEVAANSVAGGGVDLNPTGYAKRDKRKKCDIDKMFKRANGLGIIEKLMKKRKCSK